MKQHQHPPDPPNGKGSCLSEEIYCPSAKSWKPVVLRHILGQLFDLFILLLFSSYVSGKPLRAPFLPIRKHPSFVRPHRLGAEKLLSRSEH